MSALLFGRHDNARWLLDHGADPGLTTAAGSPLSMMGSSLAAPDPDLMQRLLPHDRTGAGAAPHSLLAAAKGGQTEVIRALLDQSAPIDATDADGDTALHHACRRGSAAAVRVLLERGAATEARNGHGETPLAVVWAGWGDRVACVDALLAHGADPRARNREGRWASEFAAIHGEPRIVKALRRQAEDHFPVSSDPVDWHAHERVAALVAALMGRDATGVAQWIESPALEPDRLLRIVSLDPRRVLFLAVELGSVDLTRRLLDAGVEVDTADGDGNTALNIAARHGRVDVATLLLDRGADIEARTERGYTPIEFAQDDAMIRLLRKRGARTRA
jgi:ankyrin repeat protein